MNIFKRNKKGMIPKAIEEVGSALIVLLFGILILSFLSSNIVDEREEESKIFIDEAVASNIVGIYLKQPVIVDGVEMTMADLTALAAGNPTKYKEIWAAHTEKMFGLEYVFIEIKDTKVKYDPFKTHGIDELSIMGKRVGHESIVVLPSYNGRIELVFKYYMKYKKKTLPGGLL